MDDNRLQKSLILTLQAELSSREAEIQQLKQELKETTAHQRKFMEVLAGGRDLTISRIGGPPGHWGNFRPCYVENQPQAATQHAREVCLDRFGEPMDPAYNNVLSANCAICF